jgi:hypothetical protein
LSGSAVRQCFVAWRPAMACTRLVPMLRCLVMMLLCWMRLLVTAADRQSRGAPHSLPSASFWVVPPGGGGRRVPRALNKNRSFHSHRCCAKCRSLCLQKPLDRLLLPNDGFRKPLCVQQMYMLGRITCWYARGPLRRIQHLTEVENKLEILV